MSAGVGSQRLVSIKGQQKTLKIIPKIGKKKEKKIREILSGATEERDLRPFCPKDLLPLLSLSRFHSELQV